MLAVYVVIWSSAVLLGLSAVWAMVWAIRTGQFHGLKQGAAIIFDAEEPMGIPTDEFPENGRSFAIRDAEEPWQP